ncbi:MAG TPA: hypothetical protein VNJ08_00030 [Bacteriovoracaceae bacterium]|nr:hypothetical protein [Bacteriovoracaceae bacterium]
MEDGAWLSQEDKDKMEALKAELIALKKEHKAFAGKKGGVSTEERERWRANSTRMNEVYIEIKDLRFKNIMEAGKGV